MTCHDQGCRKSQSRGSGRIYSCIWAMYEFGCYGVPWVDISKAFGVLSLLWGFAGIFTGFVERFLLPEAQGDANCANQFYFSIIG